MRVCLCVLTSEMFWDRFHIVPNLSPWQLNSAQTAEWFPTSLVKVRVKVGVRHISVTLREGLLGTLVGTASSKAS